MNFAFNNLTTPKNPTSKRGFFLDLFQFLVLFIFFFTLSLTVVMFPTLVTRVSYLLGLNKNTTLTASLPQIGNADSAVNLITGNRSMLAGDWIIIPAINIQAPIIYSQSSDNATIMNDLKQGVVHYPGTAYPGQTGNVFITGHSSYYWWSGGKYNQIFANLDKVKNGDLIYLYRDNQEFIYQVYDSFVVQPADTEVLAQTPQPKLTLMTCVPIGTNLKRLIVQASLINAPSAKANVPGALEQLPNVLPI